MITWPQYINQAFSGVDPSNPHAQSYYGPYNTLLNHIFPASQGFEVAPQPQPGRDTTLLFIVKRYNSPVVFLDVRPPVHATVTPTECIQEAIVDMSHALSKVPCRVKGISAFGPKFVIYDYEYDAAANELDARSGAPALIEDGEREEDVRSEEGARCLKEVARSVGAIVTES